jgi:hypothetical protein
VDAAQARNDASWKFDAFLVLTVSRRTLRLETYRHLTAQDQWAQTDSLTLSTDGAVIAEGQKRPPRRRGGRASLVSADAVPSVAQGMRMSSQDVPSSVVGEDALSN